MPTLHILGSPYSPTHTSNRIDPFSILAHKFIKYMMSYGWNCIHYSAVGSEVDCTNVICNDEIRSDRTPNTQEFNARAALEIRARKAEGDMILCFHGIDNRAACQANSDLVAIEPSIGYDTKAVWTDYRVFVSYSHMHMFYGQRDMLMTPSWFDAVIPNAITAEEFDYYDKKDDYILFFGRVIENKGIHIAIQATKKAGKKLVIAGPGSLQDLGYRDLPSHVEVVGLCDPEKRRRLMSKAKAIIGPTYYVEPFGNMVAEGYMSGTPSITSDWGGFSETVVHGVTGFRCREFKEFVTALHEIDMIKPMDCLKFGLENYEDSVVHKKLHNYLLKIQDRDFYRE